MDNKMRIMSEEFENTNTGEKVTGITVMIDGKLKQVFDVMIKKSGGEKSYLEMLQEQFSEKFPLFQGLLK